MITSPRGEEIWKIRKREWNYGAGAGLLKRMKGVEGGCHFSYLIFSKLIIFTFRNYVTLCKLLLCIWRKIIFFCHHSFMKKIILSCLKMNLKISYKLRQPDISKGLKKSKIDFWYKATVELIQSPFWSLFKSISYM